MTLAASLAGGPVSSTQVVSLSIVGAGAAERRSKVRWALLGEIAVAWLLTVPASALIAMPLHAGLARAAAAGRRVMGFFDNGLAERQQVHRHADRARGQGARRRSRCLESGARARGHRGGRAPARALRTNRRERRRVLIDELHETFVTPIDREDIYNLSQSFERMVTYALTTLEEMHLLQVAADEPIRRMVALVREQADDLEAAMRGCAKNPRVADDHADHVHEKEREVERIYRAAIRDLFARATDPQGLPAILYRREVYRHISNMADRAVSAANMLGMVVMKIA